MVRIWTNAFIMVLAVTSITIIGLSAMTVPPKPKIYPVTDMLRRQVSLEAALSLLTEETRNLTVAIREVEGKKVALKPLKIRRREILRDLARLETSSRELQEKLMQ